MANPHVPCQKRLTWLFEVTKSHMDGKVSYLTELWE